MARLTGEQSIADCTIAYFVEETNGDVAGEGESSSGKEKIKHEPYDRSLPAQHLVRTL